MVPFTRRRLLHGTVGLIAGLAGCNGLGQQSGSTGTSSPTAGRDGPPADATTSPDTVRVRVADDRPPAWLAPPDGTDGRPRPDDRSRHLSSVVVDSRARAERVETVDVPAAADARSFVENTSFDRETVYVENHRVRDCFRLDLCRVSWGRSRIETDYARTLLPYDERCAADGWAAESWLIRLPTALSADEVNGHSTSVGSAACDRTAGPDGTTEDGGGGGKGTEDGGGGGRATEERGSADTADADAVVPASHATPPGNADPDGDP
jgi:hypothetical protein